MKTQIYRRPILMAAVSAVAVAGLASPVAAQQRMNQQGDALDANNRVGDSRSYGLPRNAINDRFRLGNDLITGDVTAGRAFRGFVPYGSDRSFRDFTAGQATSTFVGNSSGVTPSGKVINNAQVVRPYYGSGQFNQVPSDYAQLPGTGGYVPPAPSVNAAPPMAGRMMAFDTQLDLRLSSDAADRFSSEYSEAFWNRLAEAPLLSPAARNLDRARVLSPYTQLARDSRLEPLTSQRLADLRSELLRDAAGQPLDSQTLEQLGGGRRAEGAESATGREMGDRALQSQAEGGVPLEPFADTARQRLDESLQRASDVRLADPAEQSTQYARLQESLLRYRDGGTPEALRPVGTPRNDDPLGMQPANRAAEPTAPGEAPAATSQPGVAVPQLVPPRAYPLPGAQAQRNAQQPVFIRSLAEGVTSQTLKRMYDQAEGLMDEGRYVSAIARYEGAERVVPNQPLTKLGLASAELGAGYYRRAAATLKTAFSQHPELLMARLDLPGLIGQKRLDEVAQTLQQRLSADANDPDPAFLLAFLAHNTGDAAQAAAMLSVAQGRSGEIFYAEVAAHWGVEARPATLPAAE